MQAFSKAIKSFYTADIRGCFVEGQSSSVNVLTHSTNQIQKMWTSDPTPLCAFTTWCLYTRNIIVLEADNSYANIA